MTALSSMLRPLAKAGLAPAATLAVRTQLALVRAITDELSRPGPTDPLHRALRDQLTDEVARLDRLMADGAMESGQHPVSVPSVG